MTIILHHRLIITGLAIVHGARPTKPRQKKYNKTITPLAYRPATTWGTFATYALAGLMITLPIATDNIMGNNAAAISYHAPSTPAWHWLATAQGQTDNGQAENGQTNNDQGTSDATKGDNPNFTITLPTPAPSSSAPMLSLREALTMAYKTDPRLRASMENIRAQRANLDATRALRLPQMTLSSNYGRSQVAVNGVTQDYAGEQKSYSLGVSAPLFTFGRQEASEKAAASQLRSANIAFEQKKIEVFNDVINTYFGVMLAQEIYKLRWQNHQLLNKQLADAMTRFDRRAITITDLRGVRARLNNDAINLIDSESQLISQQQKLTRLLNQPTNSGRDYAEAKNNSGENKIVGSNLSIASSAEFLKKIPASLAEAEVQLLQRSPTLKEANEVIVRGEAETASAKAALFPNVSLQAGLSQSNAGIEVTNQQYITMNMSMTLFNGGQTILQQTQTLAALKRARYLSADTRNNLLQDLHNRWQAYNSYESIVADRYKNLQQYQRVYEGARATFALGQITITSLIEVRQQLLTQYINYATALNSRMVYGLSIVNICNLID